MRPTPEKADSTVSRPSLSPRRCRTVTAAGCCRPRLRLGGDDVGADLVGKGVELAGRFLGAGRAAGKLGSQVFGGKGHGESLKLKRKVECK
jgi:hypothetical protein